MSTDVRALPESATRALIKAVQLAEIASDWNLSEVEIDGEMVDVIDLKREFLAALNGVET